MNNNDLQRFEEKVIKTDRCWYWIAALNHANYGTFHSKDHRSNLAHRVIWEHEHGTIPDGMTVDHLCFEPSCVNPAHLRLLTVSENCSNQRSLANTHCINGHEYTPESVYQRPGQGRYCKVCRRERMKRYYDEGKARMGRFTLDQVRDLIGGES